MKINLKRIVLLSYLAIVGSAAIAQEVPFTLTVKLNQSIPGHKIFLYYKTGPESTGVDSAACINGRYVIKGKTLKPQRAFIALAPEQRGFEVYHVTAARIPVYLEQGNILVSGEDEFKLAKLSGTPLNDDYQGYADVVNSFNPRLDSLKEKYGKANLQKDTAALRFLTPLFTILAQDTKKAEERYFLKHLNSAVSLDWLKNSLPLAKNKAKAEALFAKMGGKIKSSDSGLAFAKLLKETASITIGSMAPDFTANNAKDEPVSLSSFRGQYVLLDFWASWCGPCRKENPNVLKAYQTYKSKNFTVLGYSLDTSKMSWLSAVKQDALPWIQVSAMDAKDPVEVLYGVTSIPSNFLIDPKGKIIALDLRGAELEKALAKFIKS